MMLFNPIQYCNICVTLVTCWFDLHFNEINKFLKESDTSTLYDGIQEFKKKSFTTDYRKN